MRGSRATRVVTVVGAAVVVALLGVGVWAAVSLHNAVIGTALATAEAPPTSGQSQATTTTAPTTTTLPTTTTVPAATTPPSACAGCHVVFDVPVGGGAHVAGLVRAEGAAQAGLLGYYAGGRWVTRGLSGVTPQPEELPTTGECQTVAGTPRCLVAFTVGAHSAEAELFTVDPARGITVTGAALSDSTTTVLADLNGDGVDDVTVLRSTYQPDYADAPMYWRTYAQHAGTLTSTGCGSPSLQRTDPPATLLMGPCPN